MSGRDFALSMIHTFVAAGNCIEVRDLRNEVAQLSGRYGDGNRWVTDLADRQNQYEQERRAAQSIAAKTGETLEGLSREDIGYIVQHYSNVTDWNYTAPWLRQRIIESRARNRAKEPEVRKKLQEAEARLYKSYDCQKEGWWR
jgi:hypothetical protein